MPGQTTVAAILMRALLERGDGVEPVSPDEIPEELDRPLPPEQICGGHPKKCCYPCRSR